MLFGFPSSALAVWALTYGTLRGRLGRAASAFVSGAAVVTTSASLAWLCLAWLDTRVDWVSPQDA